MLCLGLPLWGSLGEGGRLALLGHELGHFVNGDPTRSLLAQPAYLTFARLASLIGPGRRTASESGLYAVAGVIGRWLILRPLNALFTLCHVGVAGVAARDRMRSEYYSDALALKLGGVAGSTELAETLLFGDSVYSAVHSASHSTRDHTQWQTSAREARQARRPGTRASEQESMRYDTSLFSSHPPSGRRLRAVRAWAPTAVFDSPATIAPAGEEAALEREYRRVARDLALT